MSNQKSVFESPEQQMANKQRSNDAQSTQVPNPFCRHRPWIIIVAMVVFLFVAVTVVRATGDHIQKTIREPILNYTVNSTPEIIIHADAGDVHIQSGSGSRMVMKATKHLGIFDTGTSDPEITTQQTGNTINVTTKLETSFDILGGGLSYVSLDITVPTTSNVEIQEQAGDVTIDHISGQMNIHNQAGDTTLNESHLSGSSSLSSQAGDIDFSGSLDQHGSYQFTDEAGDITLTLPSNSSLNIHTQATAGKVRNAFGEGAVGSAPQAPVNATSTAGNITIEKASYSPSSGSPGSNVSKQRLRTRSANQLVSSSLARAMLLNVVFSPRDTKSAVCLSGSS